MKDVRALVLKASCPAGDPEGRLAAFGRLVTLFQDMAIGYAYSLLGDFHLAEDAAQEAFITAFRRIAALREPEAFAPWLRKLVRTSCSRRTRRKGADAATLDAAANVSAREAEPAVAAERIEMRDRVLDAVRSLPRDLRTATALFYINGYSQKEIADFLEVPESTVNDRLHASRKRLKERMLPMVKETLHAHMPGERFSRTVIDALLARPNLLEIERHPVRQAWEAIRAALADYEVVNGGEVEDAGAFAAAEDHAWDLAYRLDDRKALRYQMTTVTMNAIRGRTPPVRVVAAGRVFRPDREDAGHSRVFHQVDAACVDSGLDPHAFKSACERVLRAAVPRAKIAWREHDYGFVAPGFEAAIERAGRSYEVLGGGMLHPDTLTRAGYDPKAVRGFAWGLGLERLAMIRLGIDDIRALWQPPYVSASPVR